MSVLVLGFALGLRHALDVDHLAAVSTIVSRSRSLWRSSLLGAVWGLGHTTALLAVAVGVIGLHAEIPPSVAHALELGVAVMLVCLGGNLLRTLVSGGHIHLHRHIHGGRVHAHPHLHTGEVADHDHGPGVRRPFLVGLVHGVAGSAGLMLAVLATIPSPARALGYVAVFGIGSIGGMMLMSALLAVPALVTAGRFRGADVALRSLAGIGSVGVGLGLAWQIGMEAGWLG